ncbi:endoglucanase precursor [Erwinia piriflorinigrans CFBP 5888]|uniref:cellulase n=2 Tax=Erwinia piriflorinigrans TaxID=665097 RepID=V5ZCG8_9GAMM|nr:glycosyl hydrolase family 8 [Erwinia piriflorinigrans]CCG89058.1 endoglucanase precursor [Erwinia piriflorinigrans CFBP 5888]
MAMFRTGLMLLALMLGMSQVAAADGWSSFKTRFMTSDGRIQDTGNRNVSHTEGQGYAMLMAVYYNDRSSFDKLWRWTQNNLTNPQNGLFYWKYDPAVDDPVSDKNNAADGDVLIAWALLLAGEKWQVASWLQQSDRIQQAIAAHNVIAFGGRTLMLPGAEGFNKTSYVVLNPSYFVFPAWRDFARRSHLKLWNQLIKDGLDLLTDMRFGDTALPLDWVVINADGSLAPATAWPARFSYDAIRIPLYLHWYDATSLRLVPFQHFWLGFPRLQTPAWLDVLTNEKAPYNMAGGLLAVRDLTLGDTGYLNDSPSASEDYYSSSLTLLAWLAFKHR